LPKGSHENEANFVQRSTLVQNDPFSNFLLQMQTMAKKELAEAAKSYEHSRDQRVQ
jgi:hypothetical protein